MRPLPIYYGLGEVSGLKRAGSIFMQADLEHAVIALDPQSR
jgi:hypothetical protein